MSGCGRVPRASVSPSLWRAPSRVPQTSTDLGGHLGVAFWGARANWGASAMPQGGHRIVGCRTLWGVQQLGVQNPLGAA